ncbi:unnamed protein product [Schistosoma mattheei]|uniref:Uncharacterized protein n=1 Tax=Schistosoma mattheei TaxID=31246 RepID=A0A183NNM9_9TREM|nr:unnamed protein product [Schistosoma mattheei]
MNLQLKSSLNILSKMNNTNNEQTNDQCKCEHITESNLLESFITSEELHISSTDNEDDDGDDDDDDGDDDDDDECTSSKLNKTLLKKSNSIRNNYNNNNNNNLYSLTNKGSTLTINKDKLVMYIKRSFKHTK